MMTVSAVAGWRWPQRHQPGGGDAGGRPERPESALDMARRACNDREFGIERMVMRRDGTEKQPTAPADRPVRAAAGAFAVSMGVAARHVAPAGSLAAPAWRAPSPLPATSNGPGSRHPNSPSQNRPPALPVNYIRRSADHRRAWRCEAGADVRRAVGVSIMGCARGSHLTSIPRLRQGASVKHLAGHPVAKQIQERGCKLILKEPCARAA